MNTNKELAEQRIHGEAGFPISIYDMHFPEDIVFLAHLHYHPEFEFLIATKEPLLVRIDAQEYFVDKGESLFINSSRLHSISAKERTDHGFLAIVFAAEFLCSREERIFQTYLYPLLQNSLRICERMEPELTAELLLLSETFKKQEFGYELLVKSQLLSIMGKLLSHSSERRTSLPNPRYECIKQALTYIEMYYMNEITLGELANTAGLSREHFCRLFSELADISPITYLNRCRIRKSKELLKNTDKAISEISVLCGFGSCSYYNKLFRRYEGQTPKEFRAKNRINYKFVKNEQPY